MKQFMSFKVALTNCFFIYKIKKINVYVNNFFKTNNLAHDIIGNQKDDFLKIYKNYANEVTKSTLGAELFGSWYVLFGNQNQIINLWRYKNGYSDLDR